jgi:hypothetical protein
VVNDAELFGLARRHVRVALQRRVDLLGAAPAVLLDDVAQCLSRVLGLVRRRVGRRDRRDACGGPRRERTSLPCNLNQTVDTEGTRVRVYVSHTPWRGGILYKPGKCYPEPVSHPM